MNEQWSEEYRRLEKCRNYEWARIVVVERNVWPPGAVMAARHAAGETVKQIAASMRFSVQTVERNIVTAGIDHRCGSRCDAYVGSYEIDEFLARRPLPCGRDCACRIRFGGLRQAKAAHPD